MLYLQYYKQNIINLKKKDLKDQEYEERNPLGTVTRDTQVYHRQGQRERI